MTPTAERLFTVCDATWPAARQWDEGDWTFREGRGGGKRVSAMTSAIGRDVGDIAEAEEGTRAIGQQPLFMIRDGEAALDTALAERGYDIVDPVTIYTLPIDRLTDVPVPRVTAFTIWEPLAIMAEIWAKGGIGPARLDVMARARIKTGILARWNEKPAGAAFAGLHNDICMVHAVEVLPEQRRQGVAVWMMRRAAFWAAERRATHLSVLCVKENHAANALYRALGFVPAGHYHYRQRP